MSVSRGRVDFETIPLVVPGRITEIDPRERQAQAGAHSEAARLQIGREGCRVDFGLLGISVVVVWTVDAVREDLVPKDVNAIVGSWNELLKLRRAADDVVNALDVRFLQPRHDASATADRLINH